MSIARLRPRRSIALLGICTSIALLAATFTGMLTAATALSSPAHAEGVGEAIGRGEVIARAHYWLRLNVPYSQSAYHVGPGEKRTYRTDCSGFVSMAWHLSTSRWTGNLGEVSHTIKYASLKPGDILMRNPSSTSGHVVIFAGWTSSKKTAMRIIEEASTADDMNYRVVTVDNRRAGGYTAYRYNKIIDDKSGSVGTHSTSGMRCNHQKGTTINLKARRDVYVQSDECLSYDKSARTLTGTIVVKWSPGKNGDDSSNTTRHRFDSVGVGLQFQRGDKTRVEATCSLTKALNASMSGTKTCTFVHKSPSSGSWTADGFLQWNRDNDGKYLMGPWYVYGSPNLKV